MILVTGAHGNNGRELIPLLLRLRAPVRAMVRREPGPLDQKRSGLEYLLADFDDPASLDRALDGVDRAFLVTNSSERAEEQQLRFVERARAACLQRIVYLSQLRAAAESPVRFLRYHAVVEDAISDSGIAFTHLRPNLYMQGLLGFRRPIQTEGRFAAPAGDARVSIVDVRDIAAVAAVALTQDGHQGRIYDLTGPEALTHAQMASQLSEALGKPVSFADVPEQSMRELLRTLHVSGWQADGLIEDYAHYRRGEASQVSTAVQDVTGRPPHSFRAFARDYRQAFLQAGAAGVQS